MELKLVFINFIQIHLFIFIIISLLGTPIKSDEISCNLTHPILKNGKCEYIFCSQEEFKSSICIIKNEIIKTQWLTSFIPISDLNYRYISPTISKNNDLIILTTKSTGSPTRKFFGINKDGRYYFKDSNDEEYPYFSINAGEGENTDLHMYDNIGAIIKLENDENDYFIIVGVYGTSYTELIDFKNRIINRMASNSFYRFPIFSEIGTIFEMSKDFSDNKKYYIFSFTVLSESYYFYLTKIMTFNSTDISNGYSRIQYKTQFSSRLSKISSCFEAFPSYYIFCFCLDSEFNFKVFIYDSTLELDIKYSNYIDSTSEEEGDQNFFLKALHLKENVGFFLYYKTIIYLYPFIQIKEYDGN